MKVFFLHCFINLLGLTVQADQVCNGVDLDSDCWEEIEDRRRGMNVALKGKATLSNLYGHGIAYNAIDGNRDGIYDHGSCAHTKVHLSPWWRVDLLQKYKVFSVIITTEVSVPERLDGAEIRIGNSLIDNGVNNPRCDIISSVPAGFSVTYECNGMEGRYVTVVIPGRIGHLILCEVEVYGLPLDSKAQ
ncbi:fucolectin-like [Sardina pilchardus]|uniref:fucolectin-like n=1 Tax=Sardina pilchardus TaxID=27697 RepID=UPI002E0EB6D2